MNHVLELGERGVTCYRRAFQSKVRIVRLAKEREEMDRPSSGLKPAR
jgi:hypothetical protein